MDASQWSQQVVSSLGRPMEEVTSTTPPNNNNPNNNSTNSRGTITQQQEASSERRTRPQKDQILNCPRCHSTNTKFCYYNNYSLTQPRYFCKTCRRYWTQGGTLRSVPVGGGSRKNKRSLSSTSSTPPSLQPPPPPSPLSSSTTTQPITSLSHLLTSSQNPNFKFLEAQDLNLSFPIQGLFHHQLPKIEGNNNININNESKSENYELPININGNISTNNNSCTTTNNTTNNNNSTPFSALELLRSGIASRESLNNPFIPMSIPDSNTFYQSGYPNLHEFKPSMNLFSSPSHEVNNNGHNNMLGSVDHQDNNNDNNNSSNNENNSNTGARLLFPFADMNKLATNTHQHHDDHIDVHDQSKGNIGNDDHHHHQNLHSGYWSGMLGGGPW